MAGDEEKKKKKKVKKVAAPVEEAPAAAEPEPVAEPEPAPAAGEPEEPAYVPAPQEPEEAPAEAAPAEQAPVDGEAAAEEGELPPQPKKKPRFFVHWDRRKPKFYDYNFDYGTNYYSSMVGYVDQKNTAFFNQGAADVPRRMAFAERGIYSSLERKRNPDVATQNLLNNVRSSIRGFETSQRVYAYGKRN